LNLTNKRSFVHLANKRRVEESDVPDKFRVAACLKNHFKLYALTGEALEIPGKQYARWPDLFVKSHVPQLAILLHGGWHGEGEIVRQYDVKAQDDYKLLPVQLIEIYSEQTDGYDEAAIVEHMEQLGFVDLNPGLLPGK
jgi:hypothetical protein